MLDLMVDFGIGQVLGVIAAWYLVTGQIVFVPWLVIIIGWKLGDMLLPNSASNINSPFYGLWYPLQKPPSSGGMMMA